MFLIEIAIEDNISKEEIFDKTDKILESLKDCNSALCVKVVPETKWERIKELLKEIWWEICNG